MNKMGWILALGLCSLSAIASEDYDNEEFATYQEPQQQEPPVVLTAKKSENSDEFEGGAYPTYSPQWIRAQIEKSLKIACRGDQCVLSSVTSKSDAFTTEFNIGYSNQMGGVGTGGSGTGVVVVGNQGYGTTPSPYIGLTLRYIRGRCTQSVNVPRSLFYAMNSYLYQLVNEDGSAKRNFDPAEQTMILFYSTVIKQAAGCTPVTR